MFPVTYDPRFPNDSYFLQTFSQDKQIAWFGEGTYSFTDQFKTTVGRALLEDEVLLQHADRRPAAVPAAAVQQRRQEGELLHAEGELCSTRTIRAILYYFTYAKGFRPGGANNPVPQPACATDFANFGITQAPPTFNSDTVDSFEVGAKNNFDNRVKIASSIYYIRWNNIQQTVVPPICQISFITNLGQAVAKGADIQAEIAADRQPHRRSNRRLHRCALHRGLAAVPGGDHADRRERRCHRRPERPARAAGHRLDRTRIQVHDVRAGVVRSGRR